jgi:hypothetical protein
LHGHTHQGSLRSHLRSRQLTCTDRPRRRCGQPVLNTTRSATMPSLATGAPRPYLSMIHTKRITFCFGGMYQTLGPTSPSVTSVLPNFSVSHLRFVTHTHTYAHRSLSVSSCPCVSLSLSLSLSPSLPLFLSLSVCVCVYVCVCVCVCPCLSVCVV